jgi:hypothetical protein
MKKALLGFVLLIILSCSNDNEKGCPNGKIKGQSNIQGRCFITLDNGSEVDINCNDFDKYPTNTCYEGVKK